MTSIKIDLKEDNVVPKAFQADSQLSQATSSQAVKLSSLRQGQSARIGAVGFGAIGSSRLEELNAERSSSFSPSASYDQKNGDLQICKDSHLCHSLQALGLRVGSLLEVCRQGGACIVKVQGTRVGLSPMVAQQISVIPMAV